MAESGQLALLLGLFLSGYAVLVDLLGTWRKDPGLIKSGRNATVACLVCLTIAITVLWVSLVRCDFSVSYAAEHTSKSLPLVYRVSALWAGGAGSLLLWLWLQVGFVVLVFCKSEADQRIFAGGARAIANLVCVFFLVILIWDKNPFALLVPVPADGAGLNPLLQHPAMVLHPPTLFIGYAALAIPFGWAFASLRYNGTQGAGPLFRQVRNWILLAWLFLTVGIVLGAWWAYEELGWGGYWAWDPVENSSLMPWLTATALLHCCRTYKPNTSIANWLRVLGLITFSLCIFGTFLTRYGLVSSVHAFPEAGLGILFLVLLVLIWVIAGILLWRAHKHRKISAHAAVGAGHKFVTLSNWLMVLLTFVILVGTLFPFLSGLFTEQKITLKPEYFTKITAPVGLAVLLLLGVCPYLLRYGISRNRRLFGAAFFGVIAVAAWLLTKSLAIPCFIICGFAAINLGVDLFGHSSGLGKNKQPVGPRKGLRWYGARIVHISVVLIFVGIAGSGAYEIEKQAALNIGQSITVGEFNIKFEGLRADHGSGFSEVTADITVSKGQKAVAKLNPSQVYYYGSAKQTSEVDIKRSLGGDIYVGLTAVDKSSGLVNLRVLIKPLINLIWVGGAGLVLGACLVLISFCRHKRN